MLRYVMSTELTGKQIAFVEQIVEHVKIAAVLTNDYFGYEKERYEHEEGLPGRLLNAVDVLMRQYGMSSGEAKAKLKNIILEHELQYGELRDSLRNDPAVGDELKRYVDALGLLVAGNNLWSATTPRYHEIKSTAQGTTKSGIYTNGNITQVLGDKSASVAWYRPSDNVSYEAVAFQSQSCRLTLPADRPCAV
jgi:hypothetical protein